MMMVNQFELEQIREVSQKMLSSAEEGDWEKLPEFESERQKMMYSFFEGEQSIQSFSLQEQAQVAQVINEVLLLNGNISNLAEQGKNAITGQLHGMKKRQNVHSAYLQNR